MIQEVHTTAKTISEMGIMVTLSAVYIVLTLGIMFGMFKWFKSIFDKTMNDLLNETRKQNDMLNDISEGLRSENFLRIKNMSGPHFELAVEKIIKLISRVRKENNLDDKEKTKKKIDTLVTNLHENRKSKFDSFNFHGRKVSDYVNPEWIDWVTEVVENEVYAPDMNASRIYTNVKAVYDKIQADFYKRLNNH